MAERGGFEPPNGEIPLTVFETAAFDRSAISPEKCEKRVNLIYSAIAKMQARIAFFIVRPGRAPAGRRAGGGRPRRHPSFKSDPSAREAIAAFQIPRSSRTLSAQPERGSFFAALFLREVSRFADRIFFPFSRESRPGK